MLKKQLVTLEIVFDPQDSPPPSMWNWREELSNAIKVKQVAACMTFELTQDEVDKLVS